MVFLIQNTQNRDTTTIQLKLDELIRANENAHNRMMRLEDLTENQIKHLKEGFASAVPAEAIREPLEAAQQGLTDVSEGIKAAKSHLPPPENQKRRPSSPEPRAGGDRPDDNETEAAVQHTECSTSC
jgi:hypothetical protein